MPQKLCIKHVPVGDTVQQGSQLSCNSAFTGAHVKPLLTALGLSIGRGRSDLRTGPQRLSSHGTDRAYGVTHPHTSSRCESADAGLFGLVCGQDVQS